MRFLEEIVSILEGADVGTFDTDLFASSRSKLPAGPGPFTTVMETISPRAIRTHNQRSDAYQYRDGQLRVRAASYEEARLRAWRAYTALQAIENVEVLGTWYLAIQTKQPPFDMGLDADARASVGFNFRATKRPSQ
jgi:hypothetical protein